MSYSSLRECILDLERNGHLRRISQEVDPYLEMAEIQRRVYANKGPALFFEKVKGSSFPAVSNLFGTIERSRFMFRDTLANLEKLMKLKVDPTEALKHPFKYASLIRMAPRALPWKVSSGPATFAKTTLSQLPQIHSWPKDGGPFITLPQVYTEDPDAPGVMKSNLGMYRIQMAGNAYVKDAEAGMHYQLHRGIGVHHTRHVELGKPMKVSIFVGGPPSHSFAAVMPLPEGLSELMFAGMLGNRRFRYIRYGEHVVSADADFNILGTVYPGTKPEGPFGDHLGYYSLKHEFPVLKIDAVLHRKDAIWPFTVVGRPPQEDTSFGHLIHEITGPVVPSEIPGLHEMHAVDAAGVHPLLLAIGSERYQPWIERKPREILTIANHILGFNQASLAKFLIIVAKGDNPNLDIHDIPAFFKHVLERIDWENDLHFQTRTTIDTLDYSGTDLNAGSKVVMAAAGAKRRELANELPPGFSLPAPFTDVRVVMPGILAVSGPKYDATLVETHGRASLPGNNNTSLLCDILKQKPDINGFPFIVLVDDAAFIAANLHNFLWVAFTRSNPAADIYGVDSFTEEKHWGCRGALILDARIKPHHAPVLESDPVVVKRVDVMGVTGGVLEGLV